MRPRLLNESALRLLLPCEEKRKKPVPQKEKLACHEKLVPLLGRCLSCSLLATGFVDPDCLIKDWGKQLCLSHEAQVTGM